MYRGASNVARMLPSRNAAVTVAPGEAPEDVAARLLAESNATYAARRAWRGQEPQLKFVANMDYAVWHSTCRLCVRVRSMEQAVPVEGLWVREQSWAQFARVPVHCVHGNTMQYFLWCVGDIVQKGLGQVEAALRPHGVGGVVLLYRAWDREKCEILCLQEVQALPEGTELEVVMENPGWLRRKLLNLSDSN